MPKELDDCVSKVKAQGKTESEAYAICSKSTGWKRGKGGTWIKESQNFFEMAIDEEKRTLNWLKNNKELIEEIKRLKAKLGSVSDKEEKDLLKLIKWLESKVK